MNSIALKNLRPVTVLAVFAICLMTASRAEVAEYGLEATAIYNFAKFVTWPDAAFAGAEAPLVIGVLGEDPFGKFLDDAVAGKEVNGHPLKVKRFDGFSADQAGGLKKCQILFICLSEKDKLAEILAALKGSSILTVSEIDNFPLKGGILLFDTESGKIALQVNVEAAKKSKLAISSKLLQVCKIYNSGI